MDPIFLNLGIQPSASAVGSSSVSIDGAIPSPSLNQINGLPQESKLATYISNRQLSLQTVQPGINSSRQNHIGHQHIVSSSQQSSSISLNQSSGVHASSLTKSLAALGLDSVTPRKPSLSTLSDFISPATANIGPALSHSASTPSFQSFSAPTATLASSHVTTSPSSPIRGHSPPLEPSPIRGVSAPPPNGKAPTVSVGDSSAVSTYQENVRGTTYFYTAQDMSYNPSNAPSQNSLLFLPYHVAPPTPPHIHHFKSSTNSPQFFMGDELRNEIIERQVLSMAQPDPDQYPDLPREIDMYHDIVPLEPPNSLHKSSMFGYATSAYKATNMKTGLYYCLYRIHGYRLTNTKVTHIVDIWKSLQHSNLTHLREVFTTKEFGDNSIVFVYDYFPGAETLCSRHFFNLGLAPNGWERLAASLNAAGTSSSSATPTTFGSARPGLDSRNGVVKGMMPETMLWNYIIQLTGAVRAIHTQGLACRTLDASKILLIDNKSRIRINCCGILDVLNFDPNAVNPLAGVHTYQQEDLVNLGKLIVSLSCGSNLALQRENISTAIDLINRHYSRDLATLVVCLLTSQRVKSINDVMPIIGARFYTALESATQRGDTYEAELGKEIHNGRLFRILTKLNAIVDRPQLNQDTGWSETGDRFMLKLFRDYIFHQQTEDGHPWLDFGHIVSVLNKLDCGSTDKVKILGMSNVTERAEHFNSFLFRVEEVLRKIVPRNLGGVFDSQKRCDVLALN
ncbi:PAB-dependent poly(A)-specific ribonuclease subunit PAN3 [Armadillidium nasatum]|uniref:PAN2-PAN3 deadenylation complex subunit PAN3 n=1 Tax=Armadillidium nasatum TaxID=96803 RepID=A0A5N5SQW2_9CRUS|nr:PAB-dependent poly(A)-specific ribonuclease subunit PAN3 [Armadillidium nasatum]